MSSWRFRRRKANLNTKLFARCEILPRNVCSEDSRNSPLCVRTTWTTVTGIFDHRRASSTLKSDENFKWKAIRLSIKAQLERYLGSSVEKKRVQQQIARSTSPKFLRSYSFTATSIGKKESKYPSYIYLNTRTPDVVTLRPIFRRASLNYLWCRSSLVTRLDRHCDCLFTMFYELRGIPGKCFPATTFSKWLQPQQRRQMSWKWHKNRLGLASDVITQWQDGKMKAAIRNLFVFHW